ncbi:MAG: hypothetical protein A2219_04260 [Elusimicrobia bacterium RIFOXYA2_FULL_50_26]|nr:MAG: hypothetical protein A2219_04260 [Elusimicrobia bacterium RIFOXYA2_FULL_50_26]OGS24979.1 MAG: hypothetical protein A2314_00220 [Elusimicrobia bacterium RIFOXYB2_FULL_50_12]
MQLEDQDIAWAKSAIQKTEFFALCTEDEMELLINGMGKESYRPGSTVLFQGEISSKLLLVQSGSVSIWARQGKDRMKLAELGPGSYFGEISLLTPRAATATVKAEAETEIISLPGEVVAALIKKRPVLESALKKKIEERLASRQKAIDNRE